MAAPASITLIPDVISAADGTYTESSVVIPGSPYIYRLGAGLPIPYPAGMQVIPPQGVSNAVTISGGSYGSWTQVSSAPGLGQFTVDTTISPTGGQIGFNSGDAGKTISLTYLANTYVNKAWAEAFVTALRDIRDWRGVAGGLMPLDGSSRGSAAGGLSFGGTLLDTGTASTGSTGNQTAGSPTGTPWLSSIAAWITSASIQAGSTSRRGRVTFTTGASPAGDATLFVVNLGSTYSNGFVAQLMPVWNDPSGYIISDGPCAAQHNGVGSSTGNFQVNTHNALRASTSYSFDYLVIG